MDFALNEGLNALIGQVSAGQNLTLEEASAAIEALMRGEAAEPQIAALLTALAHKGETVDEVAGAALAMRRCMTPIRSSRRGIVDTCGTGGGGSQTFNISTTAAIVAAAAGAVVAKHGNRSVTSRSGSADVLQALGVNLDASVPQVEACLEELGLCFCFAPLQHPAMRHVGAVRKKLGIRTIFNTLGPLANPAGAEHQLLGAGRSELPPLLAGAAARLGTQRTLVVHGADGLGDVSITGPTQVIEVTPAGERRLEWTPADFGVAEGPLSALLIESVEQSAAVVRAVLAGEQGPPRDIVVLNAAATLIAAEQEADPKLAAERASEAIDSGGAARLLQRLVERSHEPA
ncbi:Anthranilate phosphoribosyltransferase [Pirellulimonas nuda]|uniref:Anthranilate phosphoribosyltransferase n=1 Tax=Pirellulimonas nuda TaxID=2528009 RepID=A0A518D866_9BACT|nr:anthranilate phosphoribosyltransferase [Pirellulimonas nuda]QDU87653.1 Anthranilate phosphoribosyltransferase [Pirellulimonas nuda]